MRDANYNLALPFARRASSYPQNAALVVAGGTYSYGDLADQVSRLAAALVPLRRAGRIGVLGTRSLEAYVGILGACWAGFAYVPLNLKWPPERLVALMRLLDLDALVCDANGAALLSPEVLAAAPDFVIAHQGESVAPVREGQRIASRDRIAAAPLPDPVHVKADALGYIIFTSGTTGLPKGVMISAGSLAHYLDQSRGWTGYRPEDRIGEACDLTFDLTVHNLFLTLEAGASLHVMSQLELMAPSRFIRRQELTVWMSVPTVIGLMRQSGALKPGVLPSLRLSIFCGEPLPIEAAQAWAAAAPSSIVENIYGPTECTVIGLRQRLTSPPVMTESRGILAIGQPYPTMDVAILDDQQRPSPPGAPGEIALAGPQVGMGYFGQPELTAERFRMIEGKRWYLTGDLGSRDANGVFHHLGRVDNQVKVKGNRIELEEVDMHLRRAAGTELAATVAWPVTHGSAEGLVSFVVGTEVAEEAIRASMLASLPRYMMPSAIYRLERMPQNVNGKVDRRALIALLEIGITTTPARAPETVA